MRRNYIAEIQNKLRRVPKSASKLIRFKKRADDVSELLELARSLPGRSSQRQELLRCIPIGSIACLEGYCRLMYAATIDECDECRARTAQFKDIKFNTATVLAIQSKQVSIGQFFAHLLPVNSLGDINSVMSTLIGDDFIRLLRAWEVPPPFYSDSIKTYCDVFPEIFPGVENCFRLRHTFAHELARPRMKLDDVEDAVLAVDALVHLMEFALAGHKIH